MYDFLFNIIEDSKEEILKAERYLWSIPEAGFREWKTHAFMKTEFEKLGYEVHEAGDIPGFYADVDTEKEGPWIGIFAEMDALLIPEHPECDEETGAVHACAHHCQCAAMLGLAKALKADGALNNLVGGVRLFVVPAEEGIELGYRIDLVKKGVLHFICGKQEFMYRGFLDGIDIGMMIHGGGHPFSIEIGGNGYICKKHTFIGKASHGAAPSSGINALYAATNALSAANAIRERFSGDSKFRFHPIVTKGGEATNVIPAEVTVESFVRGGSVEQIIRANDAINQAFAGSAAAMGCRLVIEDMLGAMPRREDDNLRNVFVDVAKTLFKEDEIHPRRPWNAGCTDMGDISSVMPSIIAYVGTSSIPCHTKDFAVEDAYTSCIKGAKVQAGFVYKLLSDDAALARKAITEYKPPFSSIEEYLSTAKKLMMFNDAVFYNQDNSITIKTKE